MAATAIPARRSLTRADDLVAMAVRATGRLAFAALVVFHAWLFWTHVAAGKLFEPQIALRWVVAVGVLVGFRALSRVGLPLFFGKRAVVLWLLVILIHCHAVWTGDATSAELGIPETIGALAQLTSSVSVLGTLLVILLATSLRAGQRGRPAFSIPVVVAGLASPGCTFRFAPRPPPLA
ncbi:MAG: hypothetical protein NTY02_10585 [Acidobacteria bacterium]|nr:hypothetical protein [Acidobacteriota bacterium]